MLAFLQMRSQCHIALGFLVASAACGRPAVPEMSPVSTHGDAADLSLHGVAFARLSDGRMVARGIAAALDYRRSGGRLDASESILEVDPEPGRPLASYGTLRFEAPKAAGEIPARRGSAWGGVVADAARGDHGRTDAVDYDGVRIRSRAPVALRGPGYQVESERLVALADGSEIRLHDGVQGELQMEAGR